MTDAFLLSFQVATTHTKYKKINTDKTELAEHENSVELEDIGGGWGVGGG